jgi:phosphoribosylformimino-5-aminoimidazole carboxamide ribotide isomerase
MIILPAIDILGGECVRLFKGEYNTARKVANDPYETIRTFEKSGAEYVHLVDLDGAKQGKKTNADLFVNLAKTVSVPLELGGGIRDMETVKYYLDNGISRVILGSAALNDKEFLMRAADNYKEKIAVGIDAKDGFVSTSGWLETSKVNYIDFAKEMENAGVSCIIFTDISKDGTLEGPNLSMLKALKESVNVDITASGGVKDLDDIKALNQMDLYGAIAGRSIYDGTLDLKEAIKLTKEK